VISDLRRRFQDTCHVVKRGPTVRRIFVASNIPRNFSCSQPRMGEAPARAVSWQLFNCFPELQTEDLLVGHLPVTSVLSVVPDTAWGVALKHVDAFTQNWILLQPGPYSGGTRLKSRLKVLRNVSRGFSQCIQTFVGILPLPVHQSEAPYAT
jgi:hypothetical protein